MYNAHLHILHVAKGPASKTNGPDASLLENVHTSHRLTYQEELNKFVKNIIPHQTKVIEAVRFGQPHREIVDYAQCEDIDLIVIATHGRTGLTHIMLGSVAEKVVRFSPVPVLTVKPPRLSPIIALVSQPKQEIYEEKFSE